MIFRLNAILLLGILSAGYVLADATSVSPYIDSLKQSLPADQNPGSSYTDEQKKKLPATESSEGYTEQLKNSGALQLQGTPSTESYTDKEKQKLGPQDQKSAIEAVREGHSELQLKKPGAIKEAFGVRYGLGLSRTITANNNVGTGRDFNSIYGANYAPDISLFFEYQFYHSETYGSIGAFGMGTVAFFNGQGQFAAKILNASAPAGSLTPINPNSTGTTFRFFEFPAVGGVDYRFNLAKYLRPYVMAGPSLIGFYEGRSDGHSGNKGLSEGLWGALGVEIPMDWVSKSSDWDRYDAFGIKKTYFTIEYSRLTTFSSPVDFSVGGAYCGFVFEM